jgi:hypothetical protein
MTLTNNDARFRREKLATAAIWIAFAATDAALLWTAGNPISTAKAAWTGSMACIVLLYGAVELLNDNAALRAEVHQLCELLRAGTAAARQAQ